MVLEVCFNGFAMVVDGFCSVIYIVLQCCVNGFEKGDLIDFAIYV